MTQGNYNFLSVCLKLQQIILEKLPKNWVFWKFHLSFENMVEFLVFLSWVLKNPCKKNPVLMGEEHNVVFGQGPRVNRAKSTLTSSSICLMRHMEGEVGVLLALLTLGPCPKTTLCSSPIGVGVVVLLLLVKTLDKKK